LSELIFQEGLMLCILSVILVRVCVLLFSVINNERFSHSGW